MQRTFYVPARFHPAYSLLGRRLQRAVGDPRRAEALFLVRLVMLFLVLLLVQFGAWAWLKPAIAAAPTGSTAVIFWMSQGGALLFYLLTCVVGFAPPVTATVTRTGLHLRYGSQERTLSFNDITAVASISALAYYRQYAPYAATQRFVNRMTPRVLLLHTPDAPVALGLLPDDHDALLHHLHAHRTPAFDVPIARVA